MKKLPIKNWPEEERPREKLVKFGKEHLTSCELLAIIKDTYLTGRTKKNRGAMFASLDKDYIKKVIRISQKYIVICDFLNFYVVYLI